MGKLLVGNFRAVNRGPRSRLRDGATDDYATDWHCDPSGGGRSGAGGGGQPTDSSIGQCRGLFRSGNGVAQW